MRVLTPEFLRKMVQTREQVSDNSSIRVYGDPEHSESTCITPVGATLRSPRLSFHREKPATKPRLIEVCLKAGEIAIRSEYTKVGEL